MSVNSIAALKADAERYRWLRDRLKFHLGGYEGGDSLYTATARYWHLQTPSAFKVISGQYPHSLDDFIDEQRRQEGVEDVTT